jgi:hypothetical protein
MELARQTITIRELFAKFEKTYPIEDKTLQEKKLADYQQQLRSNAKLTNTVDGTNNETLAFVNGIRSSKELLTLPNARAG